MSRSKRRSNGKRDGQRAKPLSGVIVVLAQGNPRRRGTVQHRRFDVLLRHRNKPVQKYLEHGGDRNALNYAVRQGHARQALVGPEVKQVGRAAQGGPTPSPSHQEQEELMSVSKTASKSKKSAPTKADASPPTGGKQKPAVRLEWTKTGDLSWHAPTTPGMPGALITGHGQKWLKGKDSHPIYFVKYDTEYLGSNEGPTGLEDAKRRAERQERSPRYLTDTVDGELPAFLALTDEERRHLRDKAPPPAPGKAWGTGAAPRAAPKTEAEARAAQMRASIAPAARPPAQKLGRGLDRRAVIRVKTKTNPRKAGTTQHGRYEKILAFDDKTVEEFLSAGGDAQAIKYAAEGGHVVLEGKGD